ncbi:hypothetical protein PSA7680_01568 [Pseudoruegeria aquimaris]|uniref:YHYH domain-containing protein n=1 Tax=Pseudoruegeria aquimaris TaxID=393663 RepID=A0A1Y5S7X0_9RHOB|nr:hypothetical protein PSA7680_01568 [Pseudoruegeria aquimaris]
MAAVVLSAPAAMAQAEADGFNPSALVGEPQRVACTLETGVEAECLEFTVKYKPDDLEIGPFCPATIEEAGGIWHWTGQEAPGVYRIDGGFLAFLAEQGYVMYDAEGTVFIDDLQGERRYDNACLAAAQAEEVTVTMRLPLSPVMAETPTPLGTVAKVGVGLDGVPIFADAPTVEATGNMPALDDCGGHVDPGGWYHWHATASDITGLLSAAGVESACAVPQDPTAQFGYAFDGFALYGHLEPDGSTPVGLDACNGHAAPLQEGGAPVYHYHASEEFPNLPGCLVGVVAEGNFTTTAAQGIGSAGGQGGPGGPNGPGGVPPGFDAAAEALGVPVETLVRAVQAAGGPQAALADVAEALGVSEADMRAALPARR